jgi:hypothetical protein
LVPNKVTILAHKMSAASDTKEATRVKYVIETQQIGSLVWNRAYYSLQWLIYRQAAEEMAFGSMLSATPSGDPNSPSAIEFTLEHARIGTLDWLHALERKADKMIKNAGISIASVMMDIDDEEPKASGGAGAPAPGAVPDPEEVWKPLDHQEECRQMMEDELPEGHPPLSSLSTTVGSLHGALDGVHPHFLDEEFARRFGHIFAPSPPSGLMRQQAIPPPQNQIDAELAAEHAPSDDDINAEEMVAITASARAAAAAAFAELSANAADMPSPDTSLTHTRNCAGDLSMFAEME